MEKIETFCPECWKQVEATIEERSETLTVKGEEITATAYIACCPYCGEEIGDSRLEQENLQRVYDVYRQKHGLVTPEQIKQRREQLGLSLKSLAILLDIGEASMVRYEAGSLPTISNAALLRNIMDDAHLLKMLDLKHEDIPDYQYQKASAILRETQKVLYFVENYESNEGDRIWRGNKKVNPDYVGRCISWVAGNIPRPYITWVLKTLFIADYLAFEDCGSAITGFQYACMPYGPMVANYDIVLGAMQQNGYINLVAFDNRKLIEQTDVSPDVDVNDIKYLQTAVAFTKSFNNVNELSNATHDLPLWKNRKLGELIRFEPGNDVTNLVNSRLSEAGG